MLHFPESGWTSNCLSADSRLSWILSSPAPCELRVCEKWEVGEKLKRSHSALFCYGPTVAQVMGAGSRLVNTKHVIVIQHWAWVLRTRGNTRHMWTADRGRTPGMWREGGTPDIRPGYPCCAGDRFMLLSTLLRRHKISNKWIIKKKQVHAAGMQKLSEFS